MEHDGQVPWLTGHTPSNSTQLVKYRADLCSDLGFHPQLTPDAAGRIVCLPHTAFMLSIVRISCLLRSLSGEVQRSASKMPAPASSVSFLVTITRPPEFGERLQSCARLRFGVRGRSRSHAFDL